MTREPVIWLSGFKQYTIIMLQGVTLKLAALEDLPALEKVGADLFDKQIKTERAREFLGDSRHHLVLAYKDGLPIGMASGVHYVHPDKDPELFINEVSVMEEFQNQGVGRALVKHLCNHGKKIGCVEAWIGVDKSNLRARRAYLAAGGVEEKEPFFLVNFKW